MLQLVDRVGAPHGGDLSVFGRVVAQSVAALSIGAGLIHFSAAGQDSELPALMIAFVLLGAAQVALGALLLWRWPPRVVAVLGASLMLGALVAWLVCRIVAVPLPDDAAMEPIGFKDGTAVVLELAAVPGLLLLANRELPAVSLPSPRLGRRVLTGTTVAALALLAPAVVLDGGGHHPAETFRPGNQHHEGEPRRDAPPGRDLTV